MSSIHDLVLNGNLEQMGDPNKRINGVTPLLVAAIYGRTELVSQLVELGADANASNDKKWSALHLAVYYKSSLTPFLIKGVNPNLPNSDGDTALHIATIKNDYQRCEELLKHGANVNIRNYSGWSPLHYAVYRNTNLARLFLRHGANPQLVNLDLQSPLNFAIKSGDENILWPILINKIWPFLKIFFVARYKEPDSNFWFDRLPKDMFKILIGMISTNLLTQYKHECSDNTVYSLPKGIYFRKGPGRFKYTAIFNNKRVHFGNRRFRHYQDQVPKNMGGQLWSKLDHRNSILRKKFRLLQSGAVGKDGYPLISKPYSAAWFSYHCLN
jgi:hypothetical protein